MPSKSAESCGLSLIVNDPTPLSMNGPVELPFVRLQKPGWSWQIDTKPRCAQPTTIDATISAYPPPPWHTSTAGCGPLVVGRAITE